MTEIRWGVLSTAAIGLEHVIPAIMAAPESVVTAIASRDEGRARAAADRFDIPRAYSSYQDLLNDEGVDCVYNPLPNSLHDHWTIDALKHGHAVLCEKPMAMTAAQARQMVDASHDAGRLLGEAFMYRYHPQFKRLLRLLDEGSLGAVRMVRGSISFTISEPDIRLDYDLGGGALLDIGCYPLDAMCLIYDAAPIRAEALGFVNPDAIDETCAATIEFPGKRFGLADFSFRLPWLRAPLEVVFDQGIFRLDNAYNPGRADCTGVLIGEKGESESFVTPGINMYGAMIEDFNEAVRTGRPLEHSAEKSIRTATAIDLVRRSLRASEGPGDR